jgi:glycosyltransferase involved in cell wall biosynthesis
VIVLDDVKSPRVSVIIPFFNSEKHIRQCLDSVVAQSYSNLEILCVDDGSEDTSSEIVKGYHDERITIMHQKNQGQSIARNNGMDVCTGDYILFLDSDDYLHKDMIKKMIEKIVSEKCSVVMCRAYEFTEDGKKYHLKNSLVTEYVSSDTFTFTELGDKVMQFTFGWSWDKIYSSKLLKDNKIRHPNLKNSEDLMVAYPAMFLSDRMCYVSEHLVYHRIDNHASVSNTRRKNPTAFIDSCILLRKFLDDKGLFTDNVKRSYVNWVLEYALWNMDTLDYRPRIKVFKDLKKRGLRSFGINSAYEESYFFIPWHYQRLLCIERMPTHIFALRMALDHSSEVGFKHMISTFLKR